MDYHFLDTSAVLNGALYVYPDSYISPIMLTELESIKTSSTKDEHTKYLARVAIRAILNSSAIKNFTVSQKKIDQLLKKYKYLSNINDHRMLCEALLLSEDMNSKISFITSDSALYLFASTFPQLNAIYYSQKEQEYIENLYTGWGKYYPNELELNMIYSDPKINTLNCLTNEYAEIFEKDKLRDIQVWTGTKYRALNYKNIKNKFLETTFSPRNLEQKLAFDLL